MKKINKILLIDDDDSTNMVVSYLIKKNKLAEIVDVVRNGEEAIDYLKNNTPPELIFLDINMPRMNGWEFLEELKNTEVKLRDSLVIMMVTVSSNLLDFEQAKAYGVEIVNKPLTSEILQTIRAKLDAEM